MAENKGLALTVVSLAGFQLLAAWNTNAPSLGELRDAAPNDAAEAQKLRDADVMVGGSALILGGAVWMLTGDPTALVIMGAMFGSVSFWHHQVLKGENSWL